MSGADAVEFLQVDERLGEQSQSTFTCDIPMLHFWYVNQAYKEEIKRIEKESGVKILAEAKLTFEADKRDGSPNHAFSEFINLVHKCSGESKGFTVPLTAVSPEKWMNTLSVIQRPENKLFLTVSSEEMAICGSRQSQDAMRQSLNATRNTSTIVGESTWGSQDTPLSIGTCIEDPLVTSRLTMEESCWKLINTSFKEKVTKIKSKFGVDFKDSVRRKGEVEVRACYRKSEGKESMESHAVRALLHLYQKVTTSLRGPAKPHRADWFTESSEGASGGPVLEKQSGDNSGAPTEEGATALPKDC